jgi:hypothetical protein
VVVLLESILESRYFSRSELHGKHAPLRADYLTELRPGATVRALADLDDGLRMHMAASAITAGPDAVDPDLVWSDNLFGSALDRTVTGRAVRLKLDCHYLPLP